MLATIHGMRVSTSVGSDSGPTMILLGATLGTLFAYGLEWLLGKYVATSLP